MKLIGQTIVAAVFALSATASFAQDKKAADVKTATVDTTASKINWVGKKVTGQHNGTISLKSGTVDLAGRDIKGGTFEIDMDSIKVLDLKNPKDNAKLTGHLKSDDFFGVEKNKTATFKISNVKPLKKSSATHEITGDLTIKGKTEKITFPAIVTINGNTANAKGKLSFDRTKFDVRYGSGKFFENLGDKMINDNIELDLDLVAKI